MRGPKPKPQGNCSNCNKFCKLKRDKYCFTCYAYKLRHGQIKKLVKKELPSYFTDLQQSYLTGSLLGDGCLFRYKPSHLPYFSTHRKLEDINYNKWEAEVMNIFVCKWVTGATFDKRTGKTNEWVRFRTHRCSNFIEYYEKWYPKGIKKIPIDIKLNPLSLAIWFADDGYVREISKGRLQLKLSTHGFDLKSVELVNSILSKRYKEYFGITLEKDKPVIYASDKGARKFCEEINSFLPIGIERKALWRNVQLKPLADKNSNYLRKTKKGKRKL